jgi:hypothetical protein
MISKTTSPPMIPSLLSNASFSISSRNIACGQMERRKRKRMRTLTPKAGVQKMMQNMLTPGVTEMGLVG